MVFANLGPFSTKNGLRNGHSQVETMRRQRAKTKPRNGPEWGERPRIGHFCPRAAFAERQKQHLESA